MTTELPIVMCVDSMHQIMHFSFYVIKSQIPFSVANVSHLHDANIIGFPNSRDPESAKAHLCSTAIAKLGLFTMLFTVQMARLGLICRT